MFDFLKKDEGEESAAEEEPAAEGDDESFFSKFSSLFRTDEDEDEDVQQAEQEQAGSSEDAPEQQSSARQASARGKLFARQFLPRQVGAWRLPLMCSSQVRPRPQPPQVEGSARAAGEDTGRDASYQEAARRLHCCERADGASAVRDRQHARVGGSSGCAE